MWNRLRSLFDRRPIGEDGQLNQTAIADIIRHLTFYRECGVKRFPIADTTQDPARVYVVGPSHSIEASGSIDDWDGVKSDLCELNSVGACNVALRCLANPRKCQSLEASYLPHRQQVIINAVYMPDDSNTQMATIVVPVTEL